MTLTPLAKGFCFGEGPRWFEGLLWFSDMLGEARAHRGPAGRHDDAAAGRPRAVGAGVSSRRIAVDRFDREPSSCCAMTVTPSIPSPTCPASSPRISVTWWSTTSAAPTSAPRRARAVSSCASIPTTRPLSSPRNSTSPTGWSSRRTARRLIVAESSGRRLTAFTIGADGALSGRRVFADGLDGPPDGITLDRGGRSVGSDDTGPPVRAN